MNVAVGLMDGLGLDGDRCIRVIPQHIAISSVNYAIVYILLTRSPSGLLAQLDGILNGILHFRMPSHDFPACFCI